MRLAFAIMARIPHLPPALERDSRSVHLRMNIIKYHYSLMPLKNCLIIFNESLNGELLADKTHTRVTVNRYIAGKSLIV